MAFHQQRPIQNQAFSGNPSLSGANGGGDPPGGKKRKLPFNGHYAEDERPNKRSGQVLRFKDRVKGKCLHCDHQSHQWRWCYQICKWCHTLNHSAKRGPDNTITHFSSPCPYLVDEYGNEPYEQLSFGLNRETVEEEKEKEVMNTVAPVITELQERLAEQSRYISALERTHDAMERLDDTSQDLHEQQSRLRGVMDEQRYEYSFHGAAESRSSWYQGFVAGREQTDTQAAMTPPPSSTPPPPPPPPAALGGAPRETSRTSNGINTRRDGLSGDIRNSNYQESPRDHSGFSFRGAASAASQPRGANSNRGRQADSRPAADNDNGWTEVRRNNNRSNDGRGGRVRNVRNSGRDHGRGRGRGNGSRGSGGFSSHGRGNQGSRGRGRGRAQ